MTCRACYEDRGVNVDLRDLGTTFDNRSVEAKLNYECPECGHKVNLGL
jgi:DNA-directed RNA polymerase subunit RPC12/RpoP